MLVARLGCDHPVDGRTDHAGCATAARASREASHGTKGPRLFVRHE